MLEERGYDYGGVFRCVTQADNSGECPEVGTWIE